MYTAGIEGVTAVPIPTDDPLYTAEEAAEVLGIAYSSVRNAITRDALKVVRINERTPLIPASEIERYRRENLGKRGRPRKTPPVEPETH
jgi:hypothetical protein